MEMKVLNLDPSLGFSSTIAGGFSAVAVVAMLAAETCVSLSSRAAPITAKMFAGESPGGAPTERARVQRQSGGSLGQGWMDAEVREEEKSRVATCSEMTKPRLRDGDWPPSFWGMLKLWMTRAEDAQVGQVAFGGGHARRCLRWWVCGVQASGGGDELNSRRWAPERLNTRTACFFSSMWPPLVCLLLLVEWAAKGTVREQSRSARLNQVQ